MKFDYRKLELNLFLRWFNFTSNSRIKCLHTFVLKFKSQSSVLIQKNLSTLVHCVGTSNITRNEARGDSIYGLDLNFFTLQSAGKTSAGTTNGMAKDLYDWLVGSATTTCVV